MQPKHIHLQTLNPMDRLGGREFQAVAEEMVNNLMEAGDTVLEKKRRLTLDQVKKLERNFEEENKLEAERKVRIAEETGLNPRQVAVWFQNRRARWKIKQLEREYGVLKAHFESLKLEYGDLLRQRRLLNSTLEELRERVREEEERREKVVKIIEMVSAMEKSEEEINGVFNGEEHCNFFSLDYAPTL